VPLQSLVPFFRSSVGRRFFLFTLLCGLMAVGVGFGSYYSNLRWFRVNKGDEKVTAAQLVDAFIATYADARSKYLAKDAAPVPATFRAQAIDRFNQMRDKINALHLLWVGTPGRQIATAPADAQVADAIRGFIAEGKPKPLNQFVRVDGSLLLRSIYPSVASEEACVDCHNRLQAAGPQWHLNDVMGASVLDVPVDAFLRQSIRDSLLIGLAVFLVSTGIGLVTFLQQYREFARREATEASLVVAKEAAEAANRAKSQFLATMSHELRTPLNAIIGFSEILMSEAAKLLDPARRQGYAADVNASGRHLLEIINDILDLSRAEAGKLALNEEVVDLGEAVETTLRMMRPRADAGGIRLCDAALVPPEIAGLRGDGRIIRQVLLNLLSNAVKFTPRGGSVELAVARDERGRLLLQVRDTGIGIAGEDISRVFEPFRQIDNRLARKFDGTGLGLPLARAMMAAHGGSLDLVSEVGRGTVATATFPADRVVPAEAQPLRAAG
jgi:signal transduction histidine kinase